MTTEIPIVLPAVPEAERRPLTRTHHGDSVVDEYEWLRDREDPAVIAHLEAENAYADSRLAGLEPLRAARATGGTSAAPRRASSTRGTAVRRSPARTTGRPRCSATR